MNHHINQLLFKPYGAAGLEKGSVLKEYGANAVWFHGFDPVAFEVYNHFDLAACVEFHTFYMCPWSPEKYEGALSQIFAQNYNLLANAIDIFTPLIYAAKSGRTNEWGKEFLEKSGGIIPIVGTPHG